MDATIVGTTILLQIRTIQRSNTVHNESRLSSSGRTNKIITKFSMRIMFLQGLFIAPYTLIVNFLRDKIQDQLNFNGKSVLEFITCISIVLIFANSFANSILFLMTNVKARKVLRNFARSLARWILHSHPPWWKFSVNVLSVTYHKKMNFYRYEFTHLRQGLITYWIINATLIRNSNSQHFKIMKILKKKDHFQLQL